MVNVKEGATLPAPKLGTAPAWLLRMVRESALSTPEPQEPPQPQPRATTSQPSGDPRVERRRAYGRKALENAADELARASEGERNDLLNKKAYSLGRLVGGGVLDERDAWEVLSRVARMIGLDDRETKATFNSGMRAGQSRPKDIPDDSQGAGEARLHFDSKGSVDEETAAAETPEKEEIDRWEAVPISQLVADTGETAWTWQWYIGPQLTTLFTGLWKSGKTTLTSLLLRSLDGAYDRFCGMPVMPTRVLVITEESVRKWVERRDTFGLSDHIGIINRPFLKAPSRADWTLFLSKIALQVKRDNYGLVVMDSIFNLWPVENENDAAEVKNALIPTNGILEEGAGLLLLAHPKKGDATEGQATRGTGALPAYVDVIIEMRRHDPEHPEDTRRVLSAYSRWEETPRELVVEYDRETHDYRAIGTRAEVSAAEKLQVVLDVLPAPPTAYTVEEILQNWPTDGVVRPSARTLQRDLVHWVSCQAVGVRGDGKRGSPYRYFCA